MKGNVLLIDDSEMDLKVASSALERFGFACHGFTDHQEALKWLDENVPQMIFLDLELPGTTGFDLIPILRAHEKSATTPIVIVSGRNQTESVKRAITLGAIDYVIKPVDAMVLQEKARKVSSTFDAKFGSSAPVDTDRQPAYIARTIRLVAISEFGMEIQSDIQSKPGEILEVGTFARDFFGDEHAYTRVLSSERMPGGSDKFVMQLTFVGMTEAQRLIMRKACRTLWAKKRQEEAA